MRFNQTTVSEMISAAFDTSEIMTMTFNLFPKLYNDLNGKMRKQEIVLEVIYYAQRNGTLSEIVEYVKRENKYQYDNFSSQLIQSDSEVTEITFPSSKLLELLTG